jgi:hypothetical protein
MRTKVERNQQQMAQFVYSIPCECGRSYVGETGRPLVMQLHEYRHNVRECILQKSKLAQHAHHGGHRVGWDETRSLDTDGNNRYKKCEQLADMVYLLNPISQPSVIILMDTPYQQGSWYCTRFIGKFLD